MQVLNKIIPEDIIKKTIDILSQHEWKEGYNPDPEYKKQVKRNLELRHDESPELAEIIQTLQNIILTDHQFQTTVFPKNIIKPRFNCCKDGGSYGKHSDSALMGPGLDVRIDMSMTTFMNNADEYEGGELCLYDKGNLILSHKGNAGDAIVYPTRYIHEVKPVTKGERIVLITWIQSSIRDEFKREILSQVRWLADTTKEKEGISDTFTEVTNLYNNLLKLFVQ